VKEILKPDRFSIIADEAVDTLMLGSSAFACELDSKHTIQEQFSGFSKLDNVTIKELSQQMIDRLKPLGLDLQNCLGQAYDTMVTLQWVVMLIACKC